MNRFYQTRQRNRHPVRQSKTMMWPSYTIPVEPRGRPKGVMLTHKNVKSHALGTIAELQLADSDHWFHVAPLFHLADAWATFAITWVGGKHVILPSFNALEVMKLIQHEKITLSNLIPTMLNMMVNHPDVGNFDYSSLRVLLSGGSPDCP